LIYVEPTKDCQSQDIKTLSKFMHMNGQTEVSRLSMLSAHSFKYSKCYPLNHLQVFIFYQQVFIIQLLPVSFNSW